MRFDTLIRGGTIVTATDTYVSDVGITGGKISVIGLNLPAEGAGKVIEARAMLVMRGNIWISLSPAARSARKLSLPFSR